MPRSTYRPSAEEETLYGVKPPGEAGAPGDAPPGGPPPEANAGKAGEQEHEPETTDEELSQSQQSALVPNKVLMGPDGQPPKEGDEIVMKVIKVYGDESEVAYAPKPKPGAASDPLSSADTEIEAMDQAGAM